MAAYTAINDLFDDAPKKRVLYGDKKRKLESATHIIEFPGGAVEVSRIDDGTYWVHVAINRKQALEGQRGMWAALGSVVESRIDWSERRLEDVPSLPDGAHLTHIAVRIQPLVSDEPREAAANSYSDGVRA